MTALGLPDRWRCTFSDDGRRCTAQGLYRDPRGNRLCYTHRPDAPNGDHYPLPRHTCSGCNDPEPAGWRDTSTPPPPRHLGPHGKRTRT